MRRVYTERWPEVCSIADCGEPRHAKGLCRAHYLRQWEEKRSPAESTPREPKKGAPARFFENVVLPYEGDECIKWPFAVDRKGYARLAWRGKTRRASRVLCEVKNGPPPTPNHEAAHSCGAGRNGCVTKSHLRWATPAENTADKVRHGTVLRGEDMPAAKLTAEDVRKIRALRGRSLQADIAAQFGVTAATVGQIQRRKIWAWLD